MTAPDPTPAAPAPVARGVGRQLWMTVAILIIAIGLLIVLFILMSWRQQVTTQDELDQLRRDLCGVTSGLAGGPTPPAGPDGDRARALIPKMDALRKSSCNGEG